MTVILFRTSSIPSSTKLVNPEHFLISSASPSKNPDFVMYSTKQNPYIRNNLRFVFDDIGYSSEPPLFLYYSLYSKHTHSIFGLPINSYA